MDSNLAEKIFVSSVGVVLCSLLIVMAGAGYDEPQWETGVVRAKKDSALYVSPVNDTLVGRKILFNGKARHHKAYEIIQTGDTIKFENVSHKPVVYAGCDMKVNNKDMRQAIEQFNRTKQLQQIQREYRQK